MCSVVLLCSVMFIYEVVLMSTVVLMCKAVLMCSILLMWSVVLIFSVFYMHKFLLLMCYQQSVTRFITRFNRILPNFGEFQEILQNFTVFCRCFVQLYTFCRITHLYTVCDVRLSKRSVVSYMFHVFCDFFSLGQNRLSFQYIQHMQTIRSCILKISS